MTSFEALIAGAFSAHFGVTVPTEELVCLTRNIYFEARGESREGQLAVAYVTLNRVGKSEFADTICGVVEQENVFGVAQFSWMSDGKSDRPKDHEAYAQAMLVAIDALLGTKPDPTNGATYFYNPASAKPTWARVFAETAVIDNHRFMKD